MKPDSELIQRLRTLAEALPVDGSVTFSRADLERMTGVRLEEVIVEPGPLADLTVEDLAAELGRAPSTVREWAPRITGAYKMGREWRFPRTSVRAWLDAQSRAGAEAPGDGPIDLSSWRKHLRPDT